MQKRGVYLEIFSISKNSGKKYQAWNLSSLLHQIFKKKIIAVSYNRKLETQIPTEIMHSRSLKHVENTM